MEAVLDRRACRGGHPVCAAADRGPLHRPSGSSCLRMTLPEGAARLIGGGRPLPLGRVPMACASVRAAAVAWCCAMALAGHAAELKLVSATQSKPGEVRVLVAMPGSKAPSAADFRLRLDGGRTITATSITAVPSASARRVALLLCLDRSGSMGGTVVAMRHALRESLAPPRRPVTSAIQRRHRRIRHADDSPADADQQHTADRCVDSATGAGRRAWRQDPSARCGRWRPGRTAQLRCGRQAPAGRLGRQR